jgi:hypothetical protein
MADHEEEMAMSTLELKPAVLEQARLKMALWGIAGSGKTFTALRIGTGLLDDPMTGSYDGSKLAVIDTEHARAKKYARLFQFLHLPITHHYEPELYVEALRICQAAGVEVCIIDSLSHEWAGKNGILSFVDEQQAKQRNKLQAWQAATPRHDSFVEALMAVDMHVIATLRAKTKYAVGEDERGKMQVEKLGEGPIQRENLEYEFDVVASMTSGTLVVQKSMAHGYLGEGEVVEKPGPELGRILREWVGEGEPPAPRPEAPDDQVAELTKLLLAEGREQKAIDDVYSRMRQKDNGVLRPDWVEGELAKARERAEKAAAEANAEDKAEPKQPAEPKQSAEPKEAAKPTSADAQKAADVAPDDASSRMQAEADELAEQEARAAAEQGLPEQLV